ncbi:hypothetical protein F190043G2_32470 [Blautia caecimuris]|uniref:DUF4340 domain-containing protein n=1 Tax=Blautia caecimuris TaxID=1796615 RepID=UPI0034B6D0CF
MKSKTVKLISGVAVLAVLSGTYIGVTSYVDSQEEKEAEAADTSVSVVEMDSEKITSVSFNGTEGAEEVFEKDGDKWVKKDEPDFPVSQDTLDGAVNALTALSADQKLENPGDLSEYDLDKPQNQITLTEEDGNRIILQVGMKNEASGQYYLKKSEDDKDIYLVSAVSLEPFMGTSYEFAQAESFPAVTSATIKDVKVEKENGYQLSQDDDSLYWYVSDGKTSEQADTSKAGTVTSAIGSLTYGDFVDYNCTDQAKYGFDDPYAIITATYLAEEDAEADTDVTEASQDEDKAETASEAEETGADASEEDSTEDSDTASGEKEEAEEPGTDVSEDDNAEDSGEAEEKPQVEKQLVIYVGDEIDGNRYVKVNDSKQVYTIPETSLTDIVDKNISDFYSLTVNYLTVNNLDSLEVQSEDGAHTVQVTRETAKNTEDSTEESAGSEKEEGSGDTGEAAADTDKENEDAAENTSDEKTGTAEVEKISYVLDGKEIEETVFTTFYNKLINMAGQERLTEEYTPDEAAAFTFVFTDTEGQKTTVSYYEYDSSFYAAVTGDKVYLVNKMDIRDLTDAYQEMLNTDSSEESQEAS